MLVSDKDKSLDTFKVDTGDKRFQSIYEDPKYAIDPTNPKFKPDGAGQMLKEHNVRRSKIR